MAHHNKGAEDYQVHNHEVEYVRLCPAKSLENNLGSLKERGDIFKKLDENEDKVDGHELNIVLHLE
jgi:hypothetical protein